MNKQLFLQTSALLAFCLFFGITANHISPRGIPLRGGQWEPSNGTMHAGGYCAPKNIEMDILSLSRLLEDRENMPLLVDARTTEDYAQGHIPGAVSLALGEFDLRIGEFMEKTPPDRFIVTYCNGADCFDSHDLAQLLNGAGYRNVLVFSGGMPDWLKNDKPIEKGMP